MSRYSSLSTQGTVQYVVLQSAITQSNRLKAWEGLTPWIIGIAHTELSRVQVFKASILLAI